MRLTHYEVLGISYEATQLEIIKSFRRMALNTHPDMNNAANANEAMIRLLEAYETLCDKQARQAYDQTLTTDDKARILDNHALYYKAQRSFKEIEARIGEQVIVEYYWHDHKLTEKGELFDVARFTHLEIGALRIPFVGDHSMIANIIEAETNETIYHNPYCHLFEENHDKARIKALTWGRAEAAKQDEAEKMDRENWLARKHEMNEDVANKKATIINEGLAYVKPELKEAWLEWADYHTNDAFSAAMVMTTNRIMQELSQNTDLETITTMQNNLTGYLRDGAIIATEYFHARGAELRHYDTQENKQKKLNQ